MKSLHNKISGIYAITPNRIDITAIEQVIVKHKIGLLQYRHKATNAETRLDESTQLQQLCWKHHTLFIINDDINLAKKISADGVHLGKNDDSIQNARKQLGENAIIGVSCYNDIKLAKNAQNQGATYVAFGALFPSTTKPDAPQCTLDTITQARQQLSVPIVGIGGVNFDNQQQAFNAGCDSVAMISQLFQSTD